MSTAPVSERIELVDLDSQSLKDNPLGDPSQRRIPVCLPPGYHGSRRRYPTIYWLHGFGGSALEQINTHPWIPSVPQQLDRVIAEGAPPAILVMVDGSTRFGGSQFLNSSANGRYEDAVKETVTLIDHSFRTLALPEHRGINGKSSGGFGALALGMRNPDVFGAISSHSGDIYFEACFKPGFWRAADTIRAHGGLAAFLPAFLNAPKKTTPMLRAMGTAVAMAMAYSPNPASPHGFDLPFDEHTGELDDEVWNRWLENDPVIMAEAYATGLRSLRDIYFECGSRDQYFGHYGARILHARLERLGIAHEHQEFDDDHTAVNYRYTESLRRQCGVLQS